MSVQPQPKLDSVNESPPSSALQEKGHVPLLGSASVPSLNARQASYSATFGELPSNDEWEDLADRAGATPFMRPGWINAWAESFSETGVGAISVRRGGDLVAMMPLEHRRSMLRSPVNGHSPKFGPLAADDGAKHELLSALFENHRASIELEPVDGRADAMEQMIDVAEDSGRLVVQRTVANSPYIELSGTFEEYLKSLSRNRRKAMRRHRRRLEDQGEVTFEVNDGSSNLESVLDEVLNIEASGWKGEQGTAIASSADTTAFYRSIARWAAERGWLRIAILRLDGRSIACDYAIATGGVWYTLKAGYDEALRSYGPGALLLADEIAHCYEQQLNRIDLLGTSDDFKSSWTDQDEPRAWLRALRRNAVGFSWWAGLSLREAARPIARRAKYAMNDANVMSVAPAVAGLPVWA